MGTLFLVSTPIGNLEDVSRRALRVLGEVRLVAAEDTRVSQKLLSHFQIRARTISYFEHNKITRLDRILSELAQGDVALVSDAGTPGLNDPGYELVRAALKAGHDVRPVPGPASPIAALVASGLPTDSFLYLGYLPRKSSERRAALQRVAELPFTLVLLEAPHRLRDMLADLFFSLGERQLAVARELTKIHEQVWRGLLSEAASHFENPRGEFVVVVAGSAPQAATRWTQSRIRAAVQERLKSGQAPTALAAELARLTGWSRREIYRLASSKR